MNWVRAQWNHGYDHASVADGTDALLLIEAGRKGKRFSCGNYAATFVQCCLALGIPARRVGIRRKETDFPHGFLGNHGHQVAEAYCRELGKWVLLDADLNGSYSIGGVPANALDLHRSWHGHRGRNAEQTLDEPGFVPIHECDGISAKQMRKTWRDFNRHRTIDYYYYIHASRLHGFSRGEAPDVPNTTMFFAGIVHPPLASNFQEMAPWPIHTTREDQWAPPMDRTFMRARMLGRRPSRRIELTLRHAMPFFSHFEVAAGAWAFRRVRGDVKVLTVPLGRTTIRARCLDAFGKPGHETQLRIEARTIAAAPPT